MAQCIVTFETTHMALKFEKKCRSRELDVRVIPVPRELSSSCGFACSFPCSKRQEVDSVICENNIDIAGIHQLSESSI